MNRFLLSLPSCVFALDALACSCAVSQGFPRRSGSVVIAGTVREYLRAPRWENRPYAMEVEIDAVLRGQYQARRIVIWGDLGASCVPYVSRFPVGTKWVFAVSGPTAIPEFGDENYHFGFCETDWLPLLDGKVRVSGQGGLKEMTLEELKQWLHASGETVISRRSPARVQVRRVRRRDSR